MQFNFILFLENDYHFTVNITVQNLLNYIKYVRPKVSHKSEETEISYQNEKHSSSCPLFLTVLLIMRTWFDLDPVLKMSK